jgi:cyclophilin family peptidyl-prolyl cis-trans isomerase
MANPTATFNTSMGSFTAEIMLNEMPITASNFIDLANTGFYSGLTFHRVIDGFMNQFGCPKSRPGAPGQAGTGGPPGNTSYKHPSNGTTYSRDGGGNIKDENINKTSNAPGTLSMANTGRPNSGGSQFFINVANNSNLDWFSPGQSKHPVFGKVKSGMDVVVAISKTRTGRGDMPVTPVVMNSITMS